MPPRAVLFDADGVVQMTPNPLKWLRKFDELGGPGFRKEVFAAESTTMTGADFRPLVEDLLARRHSKATFEDVINLWFNTNPRPAVLAIVDRLRAAGVTCVLATNQQSYRGGYMQRTFDYNERFNRTFYSFEMGVAKPDVAYYLTIADALELPPEQLLMVDDMGANVDGARAAGLSAVHHRWGQRPSRLTSDLRRFGLPV